MPFFDLVLEADVENIKSLSKADDFHVVLGCQNCGEVASKPTVVCRDVPVEQACKMCRRPMTLELQAPSPALAVQEGGDKARGVVASLEVRGGGILTAFVVTGGWKVETAGGATFEDADLGEDWAEYDEDADLSVSVTNAKGSVAAPKK